MRHRFVWTFDWTWPHIKEMVSVLTVNTLYTIVTHTLPSALRSRAALHKAVKCGPRCAILLAVHHDDELASLRVICGA